MRLWDRGRCSSVILKSCLAHHDVSAQSQTGTLHLMTPSTDMAQPDAVAINRMNTNAVIAARRAVARAFCAVRWWTYSW